MTTTRRDFLKTSALATAAVPFMAHIRWQDLPYTYTPLRKNVGFFYQRGGTIGWYQRKDVSALVDAQYPDTAENLISAMSLTQAQPADVLWNTHHHGDHTQGNVYLEAYARTIVAHEQVPVLQRAQIESRGGDEDAAVYADTVFAEQHAVDLGREDMVGYHYGAGHTGGDSVVHFEKANVVHVGDLVFNEVYPYIDYNGGADLEGWVTSLNRMVEYFDRDTLFIFGHSDSPSRVTGGMEALIEKRAYLEQLIELVRNAKKEDKSKEMIMGLAPFEESRKELWQGAWKHNLEAAFILVD